MRKTILTASVCAAAFTASAGAQAQQSTSGDVIVVTAQKREQNILDVGATVTAISQQTLRDARVLEMRDIATFVPNVDIREQAPGTLPVITIRGVGLNDFSNTNNPSAGVYIDEVYLSSLGLLAFDFFDLERIEVLKGPQGTLYGRNSTAGAVNFITAKPNFDAPLTRLSASYGNYDTLEVEGVTNIPVTEELAIRLGAKSIRQWEGYYFNRAVDDDIGERNIALGRAQLRWTPGDSADILLKVEGYSNNSGLGQGAFFGAVDYTNPPSFACAAIAENEIDPTCTDFFGYSDPDGDPYTGDWSDRQFYDAKQIGATLRGVFDLGGAELTSVTGFIDHYREAYNDLDASPLTALEFLPTTDVRQYSQELRLAGNLNENFDWLVGAFWSHDHIVVGSTGYADVLFQTRTSGFGDQTTDSVAGFIHGEYALTDTLSVIGGLRLTWEEKEYTARVFDDNPFGTSCLISLTCSPGPTPQITLAAADALKAEDTNLSWKAGLDWKPLPSTLLYVSASRGVKSGGFFFGFATNSGSFQPFEPESLVSYEAGVKHQTANGALRLAASGFYYDYSDIQTFIRDQSGAVPFQRLGNVDEANLYGADLEATLAPPAIEGLTLTVGLGLLDSELGEFVALSGPAPKGNEFPNAPSVTFNTLARYERAISPGLRGVIQIDGRYSGSTFKDALNDPLIASDSFTLWNGRLAVGAEDGSWEAALWAKNIFDEAYKVQGVNLTSLGFGYENYNPPRTFGGTITVQF
ncbi:TonB-dependent receptor [Hyphococcus flavus]|uniref:TonB-dependent receptor n=1 Tax=Hyphococcus flavus TaxID=1866326 RepID=A0AAE9ZJU8_9PROT|nr:TonB-dependent receptor [Hyphococcus flavus]WDI31920.1 TonB-dependent receptor [Hyphococcus flavus]